MRQVLSFILNAAFIYLIAVTFADILLMGLLRIKVSKSIRFTKYLINKQNRIDRQPGAECSAFSSAYVLRHWGVEADGFEIYRAMPLKMKNGAVMPRAVLRLFRSKGFRIRYCTGNIAALKNEIAKGGPVILLLRTYPDKNWLHYVPAVGFDEENIFIAESLGELVNIDSMQLYNRAIPINEFRKLWNTSMLKMPFYRNTFMVIEK